MEVVTSTYRYKSLEHLQRGEPMGPRELVESALRRLTDGSLTFQLDEDAYTIAAMFRLDGEVYVHAWSKAVLADDQAAAEVGLRELLASTPIPYPA